MARFKESVLCTYCVERQALAGCSDDTQKTREPLFFSLQTVLVLYRQMTVRSSDTIRKRSTYNQVRTPKNHLPLEYSYERASCIITRSLHSISHAYPNEIQTERLESISKNSNSRWEERSDSLNIIQPWKRPRNRRKTLENHSSSKNTAPTRSTPQWMRSSSIQNRIVCWTLPMCAGTRVCPLKSPMSFLHEWEV
jgi:hypothetical protein